MHKLHRKGILQWSVALLFVCLMGFSGLTGMPLVQAASGTTSMPILDLSPTPTPTPTPLPALSLQANSITATSGTAFNGEVAFGSGVASASDVQARIDWGDGSQSSGIVSGGGGFFNVNGSHIYTNTTARDFSLTVSAMRISDGQQTSSSALAHVSVRAPLLTLKVEGPFTATAGKLLSTELASGTGGTSQNPLDYTATIDWGDGTINTGTVLLGAIGNFRVLGHHTYKRSGKFTIIVEVSQGGEAVDGTGTVICS